jgi:hypothetical protein
MNPDDGRLPARTPDCETPARHVAGRDLIAAESARVRYVAVVKAAFNSFPVSHTATPQFEPVST